MPVSIADRAPVIVRVSNVSRSGMKCLTDTAVQRDDRVSFMVAGRAVTGVVARRIDGGFAVAFLTLLGDWELECLRQTRDMAQSPPAHAHSGAIERAVRRMLGGFQT